jgi:exopolyphosphatase/guanosine-5'-triphosphate,3'-diphosphate pyrophosphatase
VTDARSVHGRPFAGVIDIGSNSVRLVLYEAPRRSPIPVFNEKVLCGLGDRDPKSGELREEAMAEALFTLRRFSRLTETIRPDKMYVVATAAARDAPNGPAFLKEVAKIGFDVRLLDGAEEARLAALGILSGAPEILKEASGGLAGDIGGGSLELCHMTPAGEDGLGDRVSLPLGCLRLASKHGQDRDAARDEIRRTLDGVDWLASCPATRFYIVGGAWRALGRLAIAQKGYAVDMLDHFRLSRSATLSLVRFVAQQSTESLLSMPHVQRRRAPTLPFAAILLEEVLARSGINQVEISANGVREGLMFADLDEAARAEDPLLALAGHISTRTSSGIRPDARVLLDFLRPLFEPFAEGEERMFEAAATLCNVATRQHPDERSILAAQTVMATPFRGLSHPERVFLAASLYARHGGAMQALETLVPMQLLTETEVSRSRALGLALRFAHALDPDGSVALAQCRLVRDEDELKLQCDEPLDSAFWGRTPAKRFEQLAAFLNLRPVPPSA